MKQCLFLLLAIGMTSMLACKGEAGDPGPAGVAGQDGSNGSANIKNLTTQIQASDWVKITDFRYSTDVDVPIITADIMNTGLVMVYWKEVQDNAWLALPFSYDQGGNARAYFYMIHLGKIEVFSTATGSAPWTETMDIRIVAASSDGRYDNPDLDWTDYTAVKAAFDLAD